MRRIHYGMKGLIGVSMALTLAATAAYAKDPNTSTASNAIIETLQHAQRVLWFSAHPDDEISAGALLARAKEISGTLFLASLTSGENSDKVWGGLRRGAAMATARAELFAKSAALFEADGYDIGPFVNGPRSRDELEAQPVTAPFRDWPATATSDEVIAKWNREGDPIGWIVRLLRERRPDLIIAMDGYCGVSGHDEHIAAAKLLLRAIPLAGDASSYPEAGEPWNVHDVIQLATVTRQLTACRYCRCEGPMPTEPVHDVFSLDRSPKFQLTYLGMQCLVGRHYQNQIEGKKWSDRDMRTACEKIESAALRAYRSAGKSPKGPPFFDSYRRYHAD